MIVDCITGKIQIVILALFYNLQYGRSDHFEGKVEFPTKKKEFWGCGEWLYRVFLIFRLNCIHNGQQFFFVKDFFFKQQADDGFQLNGI
jgi:hypothetical protein